jgi:prolyl oligopeptidase
VSSIPPVPPVDPAAAPGPHPPRADRDDVVEMLHGVQVADPYRYLEDGDSDRTVAFVTAQNAVTEPYLAQLPGRAVFDDSTLALLTAPRAGVPWERGGRYFCVANPGHLDQDQVFVADDLATLLAGKGRLLLDPNAWSEDGAAALTSLSTSRTGRLAAFARADAGSDWRTVGVLDVVDGTLQPDVLEWTKWVEPTWLPDEASLLYWRYPAPPSLEDTAALGPGELVLHRLGTPQSADETVWSRPEDSEWMTDPWVSPDGRWLILTSAPGTDSRTTISARRLSLDAAGRSVVAADEVVVVGDLADAHTVVGVQDDRLYLRTERDAPTGALVEVALADPDRRWRVLAAGTTDRVLAGARVVDGGFVVLWSVDAAHRLELLDGDAHPLWTPQLPQPVSITSLQTRHGSDEILVGVTSFATRQRRFRITVGGELTELPAPAGEVALP